MTAKSNKRKPPLQRKVAKLADTWSSLRLQLCHEKPWSKPGLNSPEVIGMLAKEAKACLYELHREHVEHFYGQGGWPSNPTSWKAFGQERDALLGADEVRPDADGVGTRYGITYSVARNGRRPEPDDGGIGPPETNESHWLTRLFNHWANECYLSVELRTLLATEKYPDELRAVIQDAFNDLAQFEIGKGQGRELMQRLQKDERGRKAIVLTTLRLASVKRMIAALLEEPFGISRDFHHLFSEAHIGFKLALRESKHRIYPMPTALIMDDIQGSDTYGLSPGGVFDSAYRSLDSGTRDLSSLLNRWVPLYLDRVGDIVRRWASHRDVVGMIERLIGQVREHDVLISVKRATEKDGPFFSGMAVQMVGPAERNLVERAQLIVVRGLEDLLVKLRQKSPPRARMLTFGELWGEEKADALRLAMKESGVAYTTDGKGKRRVLAAMHAGCDKFDKYPARMLHWKPMLEDFIPGSKWSSKMVPQDLSTCDELYRGAYQAVLSHLSE